MKTNSNVKNRIYVEMMNKVVNTKNKSDLEQFIYRHKGLIVNSLGIYHNLSQEDLEDLFQYAMLIIINAYKKYNPKKGKESTFVWQQLRRLSRNLAYIVGKFSGYKRLSVSKINEIDSNICSLDTFGDRDICADKKAEDTFTKIDERLDIERDMKIIKKLMCANAGPLEKRRYDILIDTRPYQTIARDYGLSWQCIQGIKEAGLNTLRNKIKDKGIEL